MCVDTIVCRSEICHQSNISMGCYTMSSDFPPENDMAHTVQHHERRDPPEQSYKKAKSKEQKS
jgi:hypothetical protein